MNRVYILTLLLSLFSCGNSTQEENAKIDANANSRVSQQAEPFVVVELFSSEGCSDCPAAEEVLNRMVVSAMAEKAYVYPLSFHVDYWNKLGWKDVFADSAYSNRQREYRKAFGNEVVYTPQMIVNGCVEFTGSDERRSKVVIDSFLKKTPPYYFSIHPDETVLEKGEVSFTYELISPLVIDSGNPKIICAALVERKVQSDITRGENKGKKLQHENVVRDFARANLSLAGVSIQLNSPTGKISKEHSLIVFIQDQKTMKILGANLWNF